MRLQQLIITNFRQFSERHSLHFAAQEQQNVTLIIGNQEIDKTDIWRAILFAIVGDARIGQESDEVNHQLVNRLILQNTPNHYIKAEVELIFKQDGIQYDLIRRVKEYYDGKKYEQLPQQCWLEIMNSNQTKEHFTDMQVITHKLAAIVPQEFKTVMCADYESLQFLTSVNNDSSFDSTIQTDIYHLLTMPDLAKGLQSKNKLVQHLQWLLEDTQQSDFLHSIQQQQAAINLQIQKINRNQSDYQQQYKQAQQQLTILNQLSPVFMSKSNQLTMQSNVKQQLMQMAALVKLGANQLFYDYCPEVIMKINNVRNHSEISIAEQILVETVKNKRCYLCGRDFLSNSEAEHHVNELRQSFNQTTSLACLYQIEAGINEVESNRDYFQKQQQQILKDYRTNLQNQDNNDTQEQNSTNDVIASTVEQLQTKIKDLSLQNEEDQKQLQQLRQKQTALQTKLKEYQQFQQQIPAKVQKSYLLRQIVKMLSSIETEVELENLRTKNQKIFQCFQQTTQSNTLSNSLVSSNYKDLTTNQRQLLLLSFSLALLQVNSDKTIPLLMNQPFSYFTEVNNGHLIKIIPQLVNQWIVYLTNTEFTSSIRATFLKQGNVGRIYQFNNHITPGATSIEELRNLTTIL